MQGDLAPEWTHKPTPLPMWCLNAKSRNGNWRLLRSPWEQRAPGHSDRHHRKHTESCRENGVQGQHIFSSFKLVLLRDLMFCVPSGNLLESGSWSKNISNTVSDRDIKHFLNNNVHFCTSSVLRYSLVFLEMCQRCRFTEYSEWNQLSRGSASPGSTTRAGQTQTVWAHRRVMNDLFRMNYGTWYPGVGEHAQAGQRKAAFGLISHAGSDRSREVWRWASNQVKSRSVLGAN